MKNGASHYWSLDKLKQRLDDMRLFYNCDYSTEVTPVGETPIETESTVNGGGGGWIAALSLNPARLVPNRLTMEQVPYINYCINMWMYRLNRFEIHTMMIRLHWIQWMH